MARALQVKVVGLKTAIKKVSRLRSLVKSEIIDEMEIMVKVVERDAKRRAAKDKGFHQRSINSEVEITKLQIIGLVGANQKYSKRLEDPDEDLKHRSRKGFIGKPTPSLLPALEKNQKRIVRVIARAVKKAMKMGAR